MLPILYTVPHDRKAVHCGKLTPHNRAASPKLIQKGYSPHICINSANLPTKYLTKNNQYYPRANLVTIPQFHASQNARSHLRKTHFATTYNKLHIGDGVLNPVQTLTALDPLEFPKVVVPQSTHYLVEFHQLATHYQRF